MNFVHFRLNWVLVSALACASVSLYFSAHGLISIFGATPEIVAMAIVLEVAKVSTTAWLLLHFSWRRPLSWLLSLMVVAAVALSTAGNYGYLGQRADRVRAPVVAASQGDAALRQDVERMKKDRADLYALVQSLPAEQGTNRRRTLVALLPRIAALDSAIDAGSRALVGRSAAGIREQAGIGQLHYAAEALHTSDDVVRSWVIRILGGMLDPLAVLLVLASGVHAARKAETHWLPATPVPVATPSSAADQGESFEVVAESAASLEAEPQRRPAMPELAPGVIDDGAATQIGLGPRLPRPKRGPRGGLSESLRARQG